MECAAPVEIVLIGRTAGRLVSVSLHLQAASIRPAQYNHANGPMALGNWMETRVAQDRPTLLLVVSLLLMVVACAGPEDKDDVDPTATAAEAAAASPTLPSSAEATPTATATAELETATLTSSPTPSATPTIPAASPTPEPSPTTTLTASPTPVPVSLQDSLPSAELLPAEGFSLANQGSRSALDLANSYSDSSAHLERLDEWGFKEHLFREFGRESGGDGDPDPVFVLTTVNEYGGAEQALEALDWLRLLNASQGHAFADPDPEVGDAAIASTVDTADGTPTAIVFVQLGPRIYAYFAEGGQPLDFVLELATANTERVTLTS
jgi:hypothetical protein